MKHSFAYSIALASVVVGLPHNAAPRAEDPQTPTAKGINRVFIDKGCNAAEQKQITGSFHDAQKLASALNTWEPAKTNQDVMDIYFGTNSSSSTYGQTIKNNIVREAKVYDLPKSTDNRLYIMCHVDKYRKPGTDTKCTEKYYAETWNYPGTARIDHYMLFCPLFFSSPTLATDVQKGENDKNSLQLMEGFDTNQAATFFHESFHMDSTVGIPPIWDNPVRGQPEIYGASATAELAETQNAAATMLVAECYTMAGLAIYYRETLKLPYFPMPIPKRSDPASSGVIRSKVENPGTTQGVTDPNDPNSYPSDDWIPLS